MGRGKLKSRAVQMSMMSDRSRQSLQDEDAVFSRPLVQRHPHTGEELLSCCGSTCAPSTPS